MILKQFYVTFYSYLYIYALDKLCVIITNTLTTYRVNLIKDLVYILVHVSKWLRSVGKVPRQSKNFSSSG